MLVKKMCFSNDDEIIKHLFFQCHFGRTIWSVIQLALTLYPSCSVANIFGIGFMALIIVLKSILGGSDCRNLVAMACRK
jgi:hypothetical protein